MTDRSVKNQRAAISGPTLVIAAALIGGMFVSTNTSHAGDLIAAYSAAFVAGIGAVGIVGETLTSGSARLRRHRQSCTRVKVGD